VVEVPVDDARHGQFMQRRDFLAKALGSHAKIKRCLDDVARFAAVPRDATGHSQLFERNPGAMIGQHHCERSGPALNRLHLQYGGRPPDESAAEPASNSSKYQLGYPVE
jgi:hypothetical protein